MSAPPFTIGGLGEIAIRCRDHDAMTAFYREDLGLTLLSRRPSGIVFFALGAGVAGHVQVLALFPADAEPQAGEASSLHHIALGVTRDDQERAAVWLAGRGLETRWQLFPWIGWRGLFTRDPDGNIVELVAKVAEPQ